MSRNLCSTRCGQCDGPVFRVSDFQPAAEVESIAKGPYLNGIEERLFCDARCALCGAAYLGWYPAPDQGVGDELICDLSYRSTFNDEPGDLDMPLVYPPTLEVLRSQAMAFEEQVKSEGGS